MQIKPPLSLLPLNGSCHHCAKIPLKVVHKSATVLEAQCSLLQHSENECISCELSVTASRQVSHQVCCSNVASDQMWTM